MTAVLFGEPFDTGLATAERLLEAADLVAAQQVYEQLLAATEASFLRAYLLTNIGMTQLERADLAGSAASHDEAIALLRAIASADLDPIERQLCLDVLLKALIGQGDLRRKSGDLAAALASLDEAGTLLPGFDGDGTRAAELGNTRAMVLMSRGDWGAAEEIAALTLSTTDSRVNTVPYLLTTLGLICGSTGRFDDAEDYLAQAGDLLGDEQPQLIAHRGFVAMRRGDFAVAEELYTEAAAIFERRRRPGDLAVCEQARGLLAARRGDPALAADLMSSSLAEFERHGLAVAAADTALLLSQQAYGRGDIAEMARLSEQARAVYESRGLYERCAQTDFLTAASIEEGLTRSAYGEHEAAAVDSALALAIPAALALEAMRCDFASGHARRQWLALAEEAVRLAFRLAVRRGDPGLLFELVEFRCAGVPLDRAAGEIGASAAPPDGAVKLLPDNGTAATTLSATTLSETALSGAVADVAVSEGLRVAPPPQVLMSPDSGRVALREYLDAARQRYRRRIVSEETVASW
ncbi:hypothetical protein F0L68_16045 [Solihabitans fulvus]|uniref:Uncharacterized protein n=1 Tax=Solihabitans fulvus TaxID=1892852 RepID=A0A5B2XEU7_9PSEU|nr:hypothetical protein [Solihabitans fulvus]KAA2261589.1 hypothetical protein F0L68_16045 [Solihabitans fulvus]